MEGARFIVGLQPNMALLERQPGVRILDRIEGEVSAVLVCVPLAESSSHRRWFAGVSHVYDTEEEARRVWALFGK